MTSGILVARGASRIPVDQATSAVTASQTGMSRKDQLSSNSYHHTKGKIETIERRAIWNAITALLALKMDFGTRANWNRFRDEISELEEEDNTVENRRQNMAPMNTISG
tara:strand:- start:1085 stop:1411 length:327 start_codon:yes stop_codon:yes gene_type:complete